MKNKQTPYSFMGCDGAYVRQVEGKNAYVDLAILNKSIIDAAWQNSDLDYHLKQLPAEKQNIELKDMIQKDDKFILVNGIAGIGKTTLVETILRQWSEEDLLNGTDSTPNIKLVIPLNCRDINMQNITEEKSTESILKELCPLIFKDMTLKCLEKVSKHILLLIDGVDELQNIEELEQLSRSSGMKLSPAVRFFYDLIKPDSSILYGKKVLVSGRPEACRNVQTLLESKVAVKKVEVCGFNDDSVKIYVSKYFQDDIMTTKDALQRIKASQTIRALARIPVYLVVICDLYRDNKDIGMVKTATELLLYACLVFIRNHGGVSFKNLSFQELFQNVNLQGSGNE